MTKIHNLKTVTANLTTLLLLQLGAMGSLQANEGSTADWTLAKEKKGIQVYTREIASSPFLAVMATMQVTASNERVTEAFGDGEGCAEWRKMCKSSRVLEVLSEQERIVHMVLDLPWPISDRDLVVRSTSTLDEARQMVTVEVNSIASELPSGKNVRADSKGSYSIRVVEPGTIEIIYTMHVDLGGDLSPDLINPQLVSAALDDMARLLKLAES